MTIAALTKHEYGPDDYKGKLRSIPAKGHSRLVDAYAHCPKCNAIGFTLLVRTQKGTVECSECKAFGHVYDYDINEQDIYLRVHFDWLEPVAL
jgi:transcription elongation factor Elf1